MLAALPDDLLIHIFSFLNVPDILCFRQVSLIGRNPLHADLCSIQTCRRINGLSSLRIIWLNACTTNILEKFYPFPSIALDTISEAELERRTRHAYRLSLAWLSPPESWRPRTETSMQNTPATPISDIHFVPGREGRWLLTVSKGIWSVITLWDLLNGPSKVSEWSPKGAIFTGFVVNNDVASEGVVAIGTLQDRSVALAGSHAHSYMSPAGLESRYSASKMGSCSRSHKLTRRTSPLRCKATCWRFLATWIALSYTTGAQVPMRRSSHRNRSKVSYRCVFPSFSVGISDDFHDSTTIACTSSSRTRAS